MNNYQRPMSKKKTLQVLVILTILAWATQTMIHQMGYGQVVAAPPLAATPDMIADQKYVPDDSPVTVGGTLELRSDATVVGDQIKLKQICRWSQGDDAVFTPLADLTIARADDKTPFRVISLQDVRQTLHDAGVNIAMINFAGATSCTVTRADTHVDEHTALEQWIDSKDGATPAADSTPPVGPHSTPTAASVQSPDALYTPKDAPASQSLRQLLTNDLCQRLNIPPDTIEMAFSPMDDKVLNLAEPAFKFDITPGRTFDLGPTWWDVTVFTGTENKKVNIRAMSRAWETQVIVAKPLEAKEILQESDFTQRKVLANSLPSQPLLGLSQCVGEAAAMDLKPGMIMTSHMVDPVPLVRSGQLVTITLTQGSVRIRSVGRAMESGTLGQTIKARNETSRDVFDVTVTGPQEATLGPVTVSDTNPTQN